MRFGVPVEVHAAEVYTRAMFVRFSRELFKSGSFVSVPDGDGGYRVTLVEGPVLETDSGSSEFHVKHAGNGRDWCCQCKYFEHCGMPCRHMIRVRLRKTFFVSISRYNFLPGCDMLHSMS